MKKHVLVKLVILVMGVVFLVMLGIAFFQKDDKIADLVGLPTLSSSFGNIPIVFYVESLAYPCIKGIDSVLLTSVTQAALYNDRIILLGCDLLAAFVEENRASFPWTNVKVVDLAPYLNRSDTEEFKHVYFSQKPEMAKESKWKFEFICFQRWLVLLRFMEDYHIEFIAALDHDFLLFTNMTEYVQAHPTHTDLYLSFLPPKISAHCSIMSQRALKEIDQFIRVGMTKLRLVGDNQVYNDMWFLRYYSYKAINDRLHLRNETFDYDEQCWVVGSKQDCQEYSRFGSAFPWSQLQTSHVPVSLAKSETYLAPVVRYAGEQFNSTYGEETVNGVKYRRDMGVFDHNFNRVNMFDLFLFICRLIIIVILGS